MGGNVVGGRMRFALLGPMAVSHEGEALEIRGPMPRAVLAVLLLNCNNAVSTDQLIYAVWGEQPPPTATAALHNHLARLRRWLGKEGGARIRAVAPGYLIQVEPGELDLHTFADLCASGREAARGGRWAGASADLTAALGLWRGRPVADVPRLHGQDAQIQQLLESRLQALEVRIEADIHVGRQHEVIGELRALTAEQPLREAFHGQLMLALYRADRQAESLEVFQGLRRVLIDELGVEPSPAVQELFSRILRADPGLALGAPDPDMPPSHPAHGDSAAPPPRGPAQLPADIAAFTGRADQVRQALSALSSTPGTIESGLPVPVVSVISGAAGAGKTALAVHVGHRLRAAYPDGQLYTGLGGSGSSPRDPGDVAGSFLAALGVDAAAIPQDPDAREAAYRSALSDLRVLIVLDDAKDAAQVRPLIPGSGGCAVLVTSRSRIAGLPGNQLIHLDGLGDTDARTLLEHSVGADRLADEPAATAGILGACAGLPLALAVAGARLASRPRWRVQDLADRLRPAHRRLSELAYGDLAVRAAIDLSYAALGDQGPQGDRLARSLLLLGLWTGPDLALEPTAALLGVDEAEAEQALERLVDLNLVESPAALRYRLHDLVRAYALEQADRSIPEAERSAAVARLVTWYLWAVDSANGAAERVRRRLALLERTEDPVPGPVFADAAASFAWLGAERLNLMAAVRLAADHGRFALAWQLPWLLEEFHLSRGHHADWSELSATAVESARSSGDVDAEARMLSVAANHLLETDDFDQALVYRRQVLDLHRRVGNREKEANTMVSIGIIHLGAERYQEAIDWFQEAIPIVRSVSSPFALAAVLNALAEAYSGAESFDEAIASFHESLIAARVADSRFAEAATLDGLGVTYQRCGRTAEAIECLRLAVEMQHELAEGQGEGRSLDNLAASLLADGRPAEARSCWERALKIFTELSHPQADAVAERLRELEDAGS